MGRRKGRQSSEILKFHPMGGEQEYQGVINKPFGMNVLPIAGEAVSFTAGAAGTTGIIAVDKRPILNADHGLLGSLSDTSFEFVTGTVLTTEESYNVNLTDTAQLAELDEGDYRIDYLNSRIFYCKDTAGTTDTCNYSTLQVSTELIAAATTASTIVDGGDVTQGSKADARSTATDTTAITIMQVLKEISYMSQNPASQAVTGTFYPVTQPVSEAAPASRAVTNAGTFAAQATIVDGGSVTLGAKADDKVTTTDTTAVSIMSVLKEISYMEQNPASQAVTGTFYQVTQPISEAAPASRAVTNAGVFAVQDTPAAVTTFIDQDVDNTKQPLKASAGTLYKIDCYNSNAFACFLHFYNTNTVTVGTTVPVYTIFVPAQGAASIDFSNPLDFDTYINYAATVEAKAAATDPTVGLLLSAAFI